MSVTNDTNITIKTILSLLSIIIITCVVSLVFDNNKKEGFDVGGITDDITNKWNNFKTHMQRFGIVFNEDFDKIFASIGNNFVNGFRFFGDNINILGNYFDCGLSKLENIGQCFIFYIIDIICDIIYSIIYTLLAIIGQTWILDDSIDYLKRVDCAIYDIMGFHIFQYPQTVLDNCYLCPKIVNSDNEYIGFEQPPPPDTPELENPFDELDQAF